MRSKFEQNCSSPNPAKSSQTVSSSNQASFVSFFNILVVILVSIIISIS